MKEPAGWLNIWGQEGYKVSKDKLQAFREEVTYLGVRLTQGKRQLYPERIATIQSTRLLENAKE